MKCTRCYSISVKDGISDTGVQRFRCKSCKYRFQDEYKNLACIPETNPSIILLVKEGVGIRGVSRILKTSPTTVLKRIISISKSIRKPLISFGKTYEVDEMYTYIGKKENRICITYALDRKTRGVVSFSVGRRNKRTLGMVVNTLLLSNAKEIRTDKCPTYLGLIPKELHHVKKRGINYIERKNLMLRTHNKRLNRRMIAYSKSIIVLSAILKIYFWS